MPDNKKIKRPEDAQRINMSQEYEADYWSKTLGVSKEFLTKTISDIGSDRVKDVKKYLKKA